MFTILSTFILLKNSLYTVQLLYVQKTSFTLA